MAKPSFNENTSVNILGAGTSINGDINCDGDIRIDGNLIGNLKTKGKLVIGQTGSIKGEILCKNADISGALEGKITVEELLSLKSTSKLLGDIKNTDKLNIEPGAVFTGTCNMGGNVSHKITPPIIPTQSKPVEEENTTK